MDTTTSINLWTSNICVLSTESMSDLQNLSHPFHRCSQVRRLMGPKPVVSDDRVGCTGLYSDATLLDTTQGKHQGTLCMWSCLIILMFHRRYSGTSLKSTFCIDFLRHRSGSAETTCTDTIHKQP